MVSVKVSVIGSSFTAYYLGCSLSADGGEGQNIRGISAKRYNFLPHSDKSVNLTGELSSDN